MSDRNYQAEIEDIDRQHKELMEKRRAIIDLWVLAEHPLKVGDVVRCNGYSYTGKDMVVSTVGINPCWGSWEWTGRADG